MARSALKGGWFREGAKPLKLMEPMVEEVIVRASYIKDQNYFDILIVDRITYEVATRYASLGYKKYIIDKEKRNTDKQKYKHEGSKKSYLEVINDIVEKGILKKVLAFGSNSNGICNLFLIMEQG